MKTVANNSFTKYGSSSLQCCPERNLGAIWCHDGLLQAPTGQMAEHNTGRAPNTRILQHCTQLANGQAEQFGSKVAWTQRRPNLATLSEGEILQSKQSKQTKDVFIAGDPECWSTIYRCPQTPPLLSTTYLTSYKSMSRNPATSTQKTNIHQLQAGCR